MRVAIIGNSGSGKSTLAQRIALQGDLPVLDLDTVAWEPGQVAVVRDAEAAARDVEAFCSAPGGWVVEGCYAGLISAALAFQPHLIFLEPGVDQCVANCRARPWEPHKYTSREEQDQRLEFLLQWVADYYQREDDTSLHGHRSLFDDYTGPKQMLTRLPDPSFSLAGPS